MKIIDIFSDNKTNIFLATNCKSRKILDWEIEPTELELIPDKIFNINEGGGDILLIKAKQIFKNKIIDCYASIFIARPLRRNNLDYFITIDKNEKVKSSGKCNYEDEYSIIPAIASNISSYKPLYYAKQNPEIGIQILKDGLSKASNKNSIYLDIGLILQKENRNDEALEFFLKCEEDKYPFPFLIISELYYLLGNEKKAIEYELKAKQNNNK